MGWEEDRPAYLLLGLRPQGIGLMRRYRTSWLSSKDTRRSYVKFKMDFLKLYYVDKGNFEMQ